MTQFSVALDPKTGELARLTRLLVRSEINVLAVSIADSAAVGWVRLVASPISPAGKALKAAGYRHSTRKVLFHTVQHTPGALAGVIRALARAGINIHYVYGSNADGPTGTLVIAVDDPRQAEAVLTAHKM